jgi:hypothetical protein
MKRVGGGRVALGLGLAAALLAIPAGAARADATGAYADRVRATIAHLLQGRDYAPEEGCDGGATCAALLARLRAGDFTVVAPAESSDRPDMPSYLRERKRCPGLDPLRITAAHRVYAATRGFAVYRLQLPGRGRRADEILVFRAEHYVPLERGRTLAADQTALLPGTFVAVAASGCRLLASARAVDGDWLAKHNAIDDDDHASELIEMGGRYFVLNLAPIAGPRQPKPSWWYALELWDLGPRAGADRVHQRRVFTFGYKPGAVPSDVSRIASRATPR